MIAFVLLNHLYVHRCEIQNRTLRKKCKHTALIDGCRKFFHPCVLAVKCTWKKKTFYTMNMFPWTIIIVFSVAGFCVLPVCWFTANRVCIKLPFPQNVPWKRLRIFSRVWISMCFASVWVALKPQPSSIIHYDAEWAWQIPLFSALATLLIFQDMQITLSACFVLTNISVVGLGCLTSFAVVSLMWSLRMSAAAQGLLFAIIQPSISASAVLLQDVYTSYKNTIFISHCIEVVVSFLSLMNNSARDDEFNVWEIPVYGFLSYTIGSTFAFLCILFVAPKWKCCSTPEPKPSVVMATIHVEEDDEREAAQVTQATTNELPAPPPVVSQTESRAQRTHHSHIQRARSR